MRVDAGDHRNSKTFPKIGANLSHEPRTVSDLKAHQAVVLHIIAEHGGRIIDAAGYGILAEFGSIVNVVECTVALQKTNLFAHSTA
jgi:class 3 adenylate cyclase